MHHQPGHAVMPHAVALTLRPVNLDSFAVVAASGAVLAIVPRADANSALTALCNPAAARSAGKVSHKLIATASNDNIVTLRTVRRTCVG